MSIDGINSYNYNPTLADYLNQAENKNSDVFGTSSEYTRSLNAVKNYYNTPTKSQAGSEALSRALKEITPNASGRITFQMIEQHHAELKEEFTMAVRGALRQKELPEDTEFRLVSNSDGKIEVICDDPEAKKVIEELFAENEALTEQFHYIQALGNLDRAQLNVSPEHMNMNKQAFKAGLQAQAWQTFFEASMESGNGYSSLMADFGLDSASYLLGANFTV